MFQKSISLAFLTILLFGCLLFGPTTRTSVAFYAAAGREVRVVPTSGQTGSTVTVPVEFTAAGDEIAIMFTMGYDPAKLAAPVVILGSGLEADTVLTVNTNQYGRLTVLADSTNTFALGAIEIVTVTFDVAANAAVGPTNLDLSDVSISDAQANLLPATSTVGTVQIVNETSTSSKVSGRILTPSGNGLRNARVILLDAQGVARNVVSGSLGYYEFGEVGRGGMHRIIVESKRYRFMPRNVDTTFDTYSDIVAIE